MTNYEELKKLAPWAVEHWNDPRYGQGFKVARWVDGIQYSLHDPKDKVIFFRRSDEANLAAIGANAVAIPERAAPPAGEMPALPKTVAWWIDWYDRKDKLHSRVEPSPLESHLDESAEALPLCRVEDVEPYARQYHEQQAGTDAANVHQVQLKSRKEMDRTVPRERLGWWYDVCPGQNMTLRDATASDLERCSIKQRPDRKPEDYLCELPENGSLIHRDAIQHCRTFSISAIAAQAQKESA